MNMDDLDLFLKLFTGRKGVLKQRSTKKDIAANLTRQHLIEQLSSRDSYGIYLKTKDDTVKVALFDLDVPNSKLPLRDLLAQIKQIRPTVEAIMGAAIELGLAGNNYLIEFPGVGYHIWFFFEDYIPASTAAAFLAEIKNKAGIGPVMFKPRLNRMGKETFGEAVWLPLRLNDNSNLHSVFGINWDKFDPADYNYP